MRKWRRRDTFLVILGTSSLVFLALFVNFYVLPSNSYLRRRMWELDLEPLQLTFFEGLILILTGILSLLGRRGVNAYTVRTVIYFYMRKVLYGEKMPKISEIFRRDLWLSTPSIRFGLSQEFAGMILLVIFFLTMPH